MCRTTSQGMVKGYVIVTRRHTGGRVSLAFFLLDIYCLGVKNSFYRLRMDGDEADELLDRIEHLRECPYDEAHNWIYGATSFAKCHRLTGNRTATRAQSLV